MSKLDLSYVEETSAIRSALDSFLRSQPDASPYHLGAWRAAVKDAYGYGSRLLVARHDGEITGCLSFCIIRRPLVKANWSALPFCDIGGPVGSTADIRLALTARAAQDAAAAGAAGFDIRCSAPATDAEKELVGRKVRMLLALPDSAEALMQGYPPKLRSQIRKAEKNGLSAGIETGSTAIDAFYDAYSRNMLRLGSPPHSRSWFQAICRHYGDDAFIVVVRHEDKPVGAGLVLLCGGKAAIPWASTLAEYNSLAPNMLLYWTIQSQLCAKGVREFDFGRSTFGEGTYKFKKQWGAEPRMLDWQEWNANGQLRQPEGVVNGDSKNVRALVEHAWRRLPLTVANTLGPRLRRYITL